ncbi:MAG: metallophosphoesterase [Bacteroidetes bacterium]|nr:metallophosphoesterase [Bacteroidota bacterium]
MRIIIFISVFFLIFGLTGYYVYIRTTQAFSVTFIDSITFLILYIFLMFSFFTGKLVEAFSVGFISDTLVKIGSVSIGFFLYALLFVIFFDFIRLVNYIIPFYPNFVTADYQKTRLVVGIITLSIISVIIIAGYINAKNPKIKNLDITINKKQIGFDELNIVAVSDIHLGTMVNKTKIKRLIHNIKQLNPDLVLIAGDIIDDNIKVVKHYDLLNYFKDLNPKYGVYSCMGNHEYIGRAYNQLGYFEKNGIHMLKDTTIKVDNKFYIIGRDDIGGKNFSGNKRISLDELTKDIDFKFPVFLLDHQPYKLEKTAEFAVDLQFSGHTHNGQIWPLNYLTGLLFEEDWGYLKKKNTHFYITSGYGTAVIPIRVGNKPEIINMKITNR